MMVDNVIRELQRAPEGFSTHYQQHILHLILGHHGKLEYGSPTVPKTREAMLLHYADYVDAYMSSFDEATKDLREKGQMWTGYNRLFESYLHTGAASADPSDGGPVEDTDPRLARGSRGNVDDAGGKG